MTGCLLETQSLTPEGQGKETQFEQGETGTGTTSGTRLSW